MEILIFRPMGPDSHYEFWVFPPGQKHGGFTLVILDVILSHCVKFQLVINLFRVKPSHDWTIVIKNENGVNVQKLSFCDLQKLHMLRGLGTSQFEWLCKEG